MRTTKSAPEPPEAAVPADPAGPGFIEAFRRRPARAPHGLLPGRRVWVTLGWAAAASATVTLSAVAARSTVLDSGAKDTTALTADSTVVSASAVPTNTATPSKSPSASPTLSPSAHEKRTASEEKTHAKAGQAGGHVSAAGSGSGGSAAKPAAPAPAKPAQTNKTTKSGGSSSGSGSASAPKTVQTPAQDFSRPLGAIVGRYGAFQGNCVQLVGTALKLYPCDGGADQQWQFAKDGTLRKNGRCLSLTGRSTNDGTRVVMAACDTTNVTQWRYSPGNDIVNVAADKCLDVANASTTAGTPLQIAWCSGNWAQKWNVP